MTFFKIYSSKNKLIVSNVYKLLDQSNTLQAIFDKSYKIYTSNPLRHANELTNEIYKQLLNDDIRQYTKLRTVLENEEFIIDYDMRPVVYIYKLQKHKSVEPIDIIKPVAIDNIYYIINRCSIRIHKIIFYVKLCRITVTQKLVLLQQNRKATVMTS